MSFRENLISLYNEKVFLLQASPVFRREGVILTSLPSAAARKSWANENLAIETLAHFYCQHTGALHRKKHHQQQQKTTACEINTKTLLPLINDKIIQLFSGLGWCSQNYRLGELMNLSELQ